MTKGKEGAFAEAVKLLESFLAAATGAALRGVSEDSSSTWITIEIPPEVIERAAVFVATYGKE